MLSRSTHVLTGGIEFVGPELLEPNQSPGSEYSCQVLPSLLYPHVPPLSIRFFWESLDAKDNSHRSACTSRTEWTRSPTR